MKYSLIFACSLLSGCVTTPGAAMPGAGIAWRDCADFEAVTKPAAAIDAVCRRLPDGALAISGAPSGYIAARGDYADYRLHAEWRWSGQPGNGGLLLHIAPGPKDGVWPLSQQVQTKHGNMGDLLPMAGAGFAEPLTSAPGAYPRIKARIAADNERAVGEWNSIDVVSRAGMLEVRINGVLQNHIGGAHPRAGRIGFQLEGASYELRAVNLMQID